MAIEYNHSPRAASRFPVLVLLVTDSLHIRLHADHAGVYDHYGPLNSICKRGGASLECRRARLKGRKHGENRAMWCIALRAVSIRAAVSLQN